MHNVSLPKYNPRPVPPWTATVFDSEDHGAAEFAIPPARSEAQALADEIPAGYFIRVYMGVHTIGQSSPKSRVVVWA